MKHLLLLLLLAQTCLYSQVSIGTNAPQSTFHIDALSNNTGNPNDYLDDVVITNNGYLGAGTLLPVAKIDLRGNNNFGAIGINGSSDTSLSASVAGAGAIKYYYNSTSDRGIKYSNGSTWVSRPTTYAKALVFANKSSSQSITTSTTAATNLTNWVASVDRGNNFNGNSFTAPRTGIYIATLNIAFESNTIANDSTIEVILNSNSTVGIPQFRCVYSFPGTGTNAVSNVVSGSCTGVFNLAANNTITPQVMQTIGGTSARSISADASYNSLSITEL